MQRKQYNFTHNYFGIFVCIFLLKTSLEFWARFGLSQCLRSQDTHQNQKKPKKNYKFMKTHDLPENLVRKNLCNPIISVFIMMSSLLLLRQSVCMVHLLIWCCCSLSQIFQFFFLLFFTCCFESYNFCTLLFLSARRWDFTLMRVSFGIFLFFSSIKTNNHTMKSSRLFFFYIFDIQLFFYRSI